MDLDQVLGLLRELLTVSADELAEPYTTPLALDVGGTFIWAISGALVAARRGYDIAGILFLSLVSSTGGGLMRDGIFIQNGPPILVRNPIFLVLVVVASVLVLLAGNWVQRIPRFGDVVTIVDAIGLGAYAVVGMELSIAAGLSLPGVILVGVINAIGGGLLRDVLIRREPEIFRPGTLLATAALIGCFIFLILTGLLGMNRWLAGWLTVVCVFGLRVWSLRYNVKTIPALGFDHDPQEPR